MALSGNSWAIPPNSQKFEVSIFGPGFGECVVIHFGGGEWGIVDSCLDPMSKRPAPLDYLDSLNVNIERSVRSVIATHWHDDHIQGISSVFQAAKLATFACTGAVATKEFQAVLASWNGTQSLPGGSGVHELRSILTELKRRTPDSRFPVPVLASANKVLWERKATPEVNVKALSPSDAAIIATTARLNGFAPKPSKMRRRIPNIQPNDASVVISVAVGNHKILLGADLEVRNDTGLGWKAIIHGHNEGADQQGFKIPHHGSPTAHYDDVWSKMLMPNPWAATTPFISGDVKLPKVQDCRRILNFTPEAYLTSPPQPRKFRDSNRTVEKTVFEATRSVHLFPGKYGHIRLRKDISAQSEEPWGFELFGNAIHMRDYVKGAS